MRQLNRLERTSARLRIAGTEVDLAVLWRTGTGTPLVFLHGFGSTKEDYADVVHQAALDDRPVLAYDAPGCGTSTVTDPGRVDVPFLVEVARRVLDDAGIDRCDLVGHSMGGLTALLLADAAPDRVAHLVDIEGNLAPEDCFLSRQVVDHPRATPEEFLDDFVERVRDSRYASAGIFAASVHHKVDAAVVAPIFTSMVELSEHGGLLERFLGLTCPTMLMHGDQNASLSYLPRLAAGGTVLAEIPRCGHFPMYANAPEMWDRIAEFVGAAH